MTLDADARAMPLALAALPVAVLLAAFAVAGVALDLGAEGLLLAMLAAAATATAVATARGATWGDVERSMGEKLAAALPVVLILLVIGMLIGTWMVAGTIPLLVAWGIELVDPRFFVLTAFLVTAVMSLATGTSWGSAGTLGVALMGAAGAMGAPLAATGGAVLSGAYLGDKMSPLSDSTNVCAIGAGADLYAHIRHMLWTATPSAVACLAVYAFLPARPAVVAGTVPPSAARLLAELDAAFALDLWALLPVLVVVTGIVRRAPPAIALAASSAVAIVLGVLRQGFPAADALSAAVGGFRAGMLDLGDAAASPELLRLVERGGIAAMAPTLLLVLAAFLLAAAMDVSGALARLLAALLAVARGVFGLVAATMAAGATMIALTSHGGVTSLVVGGLFQDAYRERGLAPVNLSRSLEDSVTIVEPLLPWTVSGLFMATTLGVPTLAMAPWAVFCWGGPLFSLLWAALHRRARGAIRPLAVALVAALLVVATGCGPARVPRARGVVLLSIDTLRADHLGAYGYPLPTSPNVDALARDGVVFARATSHAPSTLVSHASMLTSLVPQHHGASLSSGTALPAEVVTLAETLRAAGVRTAAFTGGGQMSPDFGLRQGFEVYDHRSFLLSVAFAKGAAWLDGVGDAPFFLFLHTYQVHHPYRLDAESERLLGGSYDGPLPDRIEVPFLKRVNRGLEHLDAADAAHVVRAYDAGIRRMDEAVGEVRAALERRGLFDDALVVLTSDHGEEFGEHGWMGWHSHSLYDELLWVPLLLKLPGGVHAGRTVDRQVRLIDLAPTVTDALGVPTPPSFEGVSLLDVLDGRVKEPLPAVAMRDNRRRGQAVRLRTWKWLDDGRLFDLAADPGERDDVATRHPRVAEQLARLLDSLARRRPAPGGPTVEPTEETLEQLRALGYVD